jgi:hypothetical protein
LSMNRQAGFSRAQQQHIACHKALPLHPAKVCVCVYVSGMSGGTGSGARVRLACVPLLPRHQHPQQPAHTALARRAPAAQVRDSMPSRAYIGQYDASGDFFITAYQVGRDGACARGCAVRRVSCVVCRVSCVMCVCDLAESGRRRGTGCTHARLAQRTQRHVPRHAPHTPHRTSACGCTTRAATGRCART